MATDLETLRIKLEADVNDLKVGLSQAQSAIKGVDNSVKQADTGMKSMIGSMKNFASTVGIAFAGTQVAQFAKDTIMAASSMAESLSKVRVVFGQGASEVEAFGKTAATNMGISNQAALEAAGTYGNLFQAFGLGQGQAQDMSMSLVQLASDMASFNNTSIDDAITALRSGLSGETEPLKRFGVALNDVRLKEQALSMGLIKTTSGVLPVAIKAQAAYALIMKDTALAQGDYARTADGTANTLKTLQARFQDAKVAIGEALMPAFRALLGLLNVLIPVLTAIGNFFKENATAIRLYAFLVLNLVAAFKAYQAILAITKTTKVAYLAIQTAMNNGIKLQTILTFNLKMAWQVLNATMRANPIGVIITALTVAGALVVAFWKKSETLRSVVISGAKVILNWWAKLIEGLAALLRVFSKIPGMGWAKGIADGAQKAADKIKIVANNLDDLNRKGAVGNFQMSTGTVLGTTVKTPTTTTTTTTQDQKVKDKIKKLKDDVKDIYDKMNGVIKDAQDARMEAEKDHEDKIADLKKTKAERIVDITKDYNKRIADIEKNYTKQKQRMFEDYEAKKEEIEKRFADRKVELLAKYNARVKDLEDKAAKDRADAILKAEEKRQSIIQQSIDRLRDAFARGAQFSIVDYFKENKGVEGYLSNLKDQLKKIQDLQKGAGELAGKGYSQTFIEQIVSQGPEMGLQIIEELRNASPQQAKEIQQTFGLLETVQDSGLDSLAISMNKGANLATAELKRAYAQVAIDLKDRLLEIDETLKQSLVDALTEYNAAVEEAEKDRREALDAAYKDYQKALKDAYDAYVEAKQDALDAMTEALADANKAYEDALIEAQQAFEKKIDDINKATLKKLADLKKSLGEAAAALAALGATNAAYNALANAPKYASGTPAYVAKGGGADAANDAKTGSGNTNITVTGVNLTNPQETASTVLSLIKYGQTVQVANDSGFTSVSNSFTGVDAAYAASKAR